MELVKENDTILKTKVDIFTGSILDISHYFDDMYKIMLDNNGLGLAATQVGLSLRFFLMRSNDTFEVFLNPEILEVSTDMLFETEGCLSFPELYLKIYRPKFIKVRYTNKENKVVEDILDEFNARCFIHEFEHLEGVTFDTKAGDFELQRAKEKRRKTNRKKTRI